MESRLAMQTVPMMEGGLVTLRAKNWVHLKETLMETSSGCLSAERMAKKMVYMMESDWV